MGHRVLVYQCGVRSVMDLNETTTCLHGSPPRRPRPRSTTPLQGIRYSVGTSTLGNTTNSAHEGRRSNSLYSTVTANTASESDDHCCVQGALINTSRSPAPRLPPPQSVHVKAGDLSGVPDGGKVQAPSQRSVHHSLQGVSPSPFEGDTYNHSHLAAHLSSDYHLSSFAEGPLLLSRAPSNPVPLSYSQGDSAMPAGAGAVEDALGATGSCSKVLGHEMMHALTPTPLGTGSVPPAGTFGSECHANPSYGVMGERNAASSHFSQRKKAKPPPLLSRFSMERHITARPVPAAERTLFSDDNFTDMCSAPHHCLLATQRLQEPSVALCAVMDAVAHTPPRFCQEGLGTGSSPVRITGGAAVSSDAAAQVATMTSLEGRTPSMCRCLGDGAAASKDIDDVEKSSRTARKVEIEGISHSSTVVTRRSRVLSSYKTPSSSPHRQECSPQIPKSQIASAVDTPTVYTCSSSPSLPNNGVLATPLPQHALHRWRGSGGTPGWESQAQTTGFPTPVKLSPIPTKGYSVYPGLVSIAVREAAPAILSSTSGASLASSPALSEICGESHEEYADKREAGFLMTGENLLKTTTRADEERREPVSLSMPRVDGAPSHSGNDIADYLSSGPSWSNISSECSVSPILARVGQTTRVWTPNPSDVSQQQLAPPVSSFTDGHSFRFLSGPPSSYVEQPRSQQQHTVSSMRNSSLLGAAVTWPRDNISYAHSNPSRISPRSEQIGKEASEDLADIADTNRHVPRQPKDRQHRRPVSLRCSTRDPAVPEVCVEFCSGGQPTSHFVADTLSLGTPAVSIIQSPAQALSESCFSLSMPPSLPYIQALPIPVLHPSHVFSTQATQRTVVAVEGVSDEVVWVPRTCGADRSRRAQAHHATLMSPGLDDSQEEIELPLPISAPSPVKPLPRPLLVSPPFFSRTSKSLNAQHLRFSVPPNVVSDASRHQCLNSLPCPRSSAVPEDRVLVHCRAEVEQPAVVSFENRWESLLSSEALAPQHQVGEQPRIEQSLTKDGSHTGEVSHMPLRSAATTLHSSTHIIDSWLSPEC